MIRAIEMKDAENLLALLKEVDQSSVMRYSPGERKLTVEMPLQLIEEMVQNPRAAIYVNEEAERLTGFCICQTDSYTRTKHIGKILIGVTEKARQQKIATKLLQAVELWAQTIGIHRLESAIYERNEAAQLFLERSGFLKEGKRVDALFIEDEYYDEICYYKIIQ